MSAATPDAPPDATPAAGYRVTLDTFQGPLDLLLYLVKRQEIDILDVPVALLAEQFLQFLAAMRELAVETAGDFLVMAATLLEIKVRSLLPATAEPEETPDEPDPRRELVRQLVEYRQFKDAAAALEHRAEKAAESVPRTQPPEPKRAGAPAVRAVELWDVVNAFARLLRETQLAPLTTVQVDETPQHVHEERVRGRLRAEPRVSLRALFAPPHTKARLIGLFLAVLELVKGQAATLEQAEPFAEIWLVAA